MMTFENKYLEIIAKCLYKYTTSVAQYVNYFGYH
jgi:hypothetical protein